MHKHKSPSYCLEGSRSLPLHKSATNQNYDGWFTYSDSAYNSTYDSVDYKQKTYYTSCQY